MKNITRKLIIIAIVLVLAMIIYISNRPRKINVDNVYAYNEVPTLIEDSGTDDTGVTGMELVVQNNFLALYFDERSTHFAVKDKRNDYTWLSSTKKFDSIAKTASIKDLQKSTFQITYLQQDNTTATMNNYEYSIAYKRDFDDSFTYELTDTGFNVTYILKDREPKGYWFPAYISADRFTELVRNPVQLEGSTMDLKNLLDYYAPMEDDPNTYEIRQLVKNEETDEYNMNELSGAQVETLFKLFYDIGYYGNNVDETGNYIEEYNLEDVTADNEQYGIIQEISQPEFVIPLEVNLNEDNLSVKINYYEIEEKNGYEIVSIKMLPYFGAARNDQQGYLVIPEGSGGLINFNNGKIASKSYSSYLYGLDNLEIPEEMTAKDIGSHLPIFGIKTETNSMLGIIEGGIAHSKVTADVSEKYDSYNKVYNEFIFKQAGSYRLAENKIQLWTEEDYTYSPVMKYYFFSEEEATYSGMASLYGEYLSHKYDLDELEHKSYDMVLDILGSYDYDDFFLWFPVNKNESLTTFAQAEMMSRELKNLGVTRQIIRYTGWFNNGIEHTVPRTINIDNALGNKRKMTAFNTYLEENGFSVYYDVDFVKTYDSGLFYSSRNYSRVIGGSVSKFYEYDPASLRPNKLTDPYYLNNISAIDLNTSSFLNDFDRFNASGISFRNIGDMIYSDYKNNQLVPREYITHYYQDILAKFNAYDIMVESGNEYALSHASYITDMETRTSELVVVDEAIPFYQLAVGRYLNYSLHAFNHMDVYEENTYLLKAIETGSSLKAMLSYTNTATLINTEFDEYYSVTYENNKEKIVSLFTEFDSLGLSNSYLMEHTILDNGLIIVTYSNGVEIVINYSNQDVLYNTQTISAQSYAVSGVN